MGKLHDRIADTMAAEVASRTEWDEAPGLCFLYVEDGKPRLSQLEIPDEIWASDRPPYVLDNISRAFGQFADLMQRVSPVSLYGAAFRCETWRAQSVPGTERHSELAAASMRHELHKHPDRVEARTLCAVDRAGITYMAEQIRGGHEVSRTVSYPKPGRPAVSGTVFEALDRLVTTLLGVELPARTGRAHG